LNSHGLFTQRILSPVGASTPYWHFTLSGPEKTNSERTFQPKRVSRGSRHGTGSCQAGNRPGTVPEATPPGVARLGAEGQGRPGARGGVLGAGLRPLDAGESLTDALPFVLGAAGIEHLDVPALRSAKREPVCWAGGRPKRGRDLRARPLGARARQISRACAHWLQLAVDALAFAARFDSAGKRNENQHHTRGHNANHPHIAPTVERKCAEMRGHRHPLFRRRRSSWAS